MKTTNVLAAGLLLGGAVPVTAQVVVPHEFEAGAPAIADEVNENFSVLADAINNTTGVVGPQGPQGDPGRDAVTILDLSVPPVVIDTSGYYVLDRDWELENPSVDESLRIIADRVTLDLRGFEIRGGIYSTEAAIHISGDSVTVRNGWVSWDVPAVVSVGSSTLLEALQITSYSSTGVGLNGPGAILRNSVVHGSEYQAVVVSADGDRALIAANSLSGGGGGDAVIWLDQESQSVVVIDNVLDCGPDEHCVEVGGSNNVFARNTFLSGWEEAGIIVSGNSNQLLDNALLSGGGGPAIRVEGTGNIIRGTLIAPPPTSGSLSFGITFTQSGNFYGNNHVSALVPFDLQGTVQTDLGGNVGF